MIVHLRKLVLWSHLTLRPSFHVRHRRRIWWDFTHVCFWQSMGELLQLLEHVIHRRSFPINLDFTAHRECWHQEVQLASEHLQLSFVLVMDLFNLKFKLVRLFSHCCSLLLEQLPQLLIQLCQLLRLGRVFLDFCFSILNCDVLLLDHRFLVRLCSIRMPYLLFEILNVLL